MLANGGFPRPLLVRDGTIEQLPVEGLPLGLLPDVRYQEHRVQLRRVRRRIRGLKRKLRKATV